MNQSSPTLEQVEELLKTVFDPEFPIVDIWTMGLIYDIQINLDLSHIDILMTLTSPSCPAGDQIVDNIKGVLESHFPDLAVNVVITFEPMWTLDHIKDEDLKRMFI